MNLRGLLTLHIYIINAFYAMQRTIMHCIVECFDPMLFVLCIDFNTGSKHVLFVLLLQGIYRTRHHQAVWISEMESLRTEEHPSPETHTWACLMFDVAGLMWWWQLESFKSSQFLFISGADPTDKWRSHKSKAIWKLEMFIFKYTIA